MDLVYIVIAAFLPSLILVYHFYKQDTIKPEPVDRIVKTFFLGFAFALLVIPPEWGLEYIFSYCTSNYIIFSFLDSFLVAGLCEETLKLLLIRFYIYNDKNFDEISDGVLYTIVASLGFAFSENIMYLTEFGIDIILPRALFAVPLHATASGIMGYYIGEAKFSNSKVKERNLLLKGLCLGIFIHGLYNFNFSILPEGINYLVNFILLCCTFKFLFNKIDIATFRDKKSLNKSRKNKTQEKINTKSLNKQMPLRMKKYLKDTTKNNDLNKEDENKSYKKGDLYND